MKGPAVDSATAEAVHKGVFLILLMNTYAKVSSVAHGPVEVVFYRGGDCQQPVHSAAG